MSESQVSAENTQKNATLSQDIISLFDPKNHSEGAKNPTMGDLLSKAEHRGFAFFLVLFALPTAIPAPPGFATPFGTVLALLSYQIMVGRHQPWFPEKLKNKPMKSATGKFLVRLSKVLKFLEKFLKPRKPLLYQSKSFRFLVAPVMLLGALFVMLPLPATNSLPAFGIGLIALGMMEEDGWFGIGGILLALVGIAVAATAAYLVVFFGMEGLSRMGIPLG